MSASENTLSTGQAATMVVIGIAAGGVYIWPGPQIRVAGQDAGWSALLSGPAVVAVLWIWHSLLRPAADSDFGSALTRVLGGWGRLLACS